MEPSGRKSFDGKSFHYPILYPNECVILCNRRSFSVVLALTAPLCPQLLEPPEPVRRDQ